jgi:hypothetical protein
MGIPAYGGSVEARTGALELGELVLFGPSDDARMEQPAIRRDDCDLAGTIDERVRRHDVSRAPVKYPRTPQVAAANLHDRRGDARQHRGDIRL